MFTISIDGVSFPVSENGRETTAEFLKEALFGKAPNSVIANSR